MTFLKKLNRSGFFSTFFSHCEPLKFLLSFMMFSKNSLPKSWHTLSIAHIGRKSIFVSMFMAIVNLPFPTPSGSYFITRYLQSSCTFWWLTLHVQPSFSCRSLRLWMERVKRNRVLSFWRRLYPTPWKKAYLTDRKGIWFSVYPMRQLRATFFSWRETFMKGVNLQQRSISIRTEIITSNGQSTRASTSTPTVWPSRLVLILTPLLCDFSLHPPLFISPSNCSTSEYSYCTCSTSCRNFLIWLQWTGFVDYPEFAGDSYFYKRAQRDTEC